MEASSLLEAKTLKLEQQPFSYLLLVKASHEAHLDSKEGGYIPLLNEKSGYSFPRGRDPGSWIHNATVLMQ